MKKFSIIIAAMMAAVTISAQTPDTVTVIEAPNQVIITETTTGTRVKVVGQKDNEDFSYTYTVQHASNDTVHTTSDWELNFPFKKSSNKEYHWSIVSSGLYFGGGVSTSYDLINNSFNWGILNIASLNYNTLHGQQFSIGVGYDNKRFSLKRPNCFFMDEATNIVGIESYPEGTVDRSSVLSVRTIQFPLQFQQFIGKKFHITLGGTMNWNVYAKCNTHYKINKTHYDVSYRGIKQNKLTFDVYGALSYNRFGIYCRYSPCNVFKKGFGPEIKNTWMLGVAIAL
jgi:hypothetical protein